MDISSEIAAIQAASQGSELRQPLVGALNKLNSGSLPAVTASDAGKILKVGANGWEVGEKSGYMPVPSASLNISTNNTYDVTNYAEAVVDVQPSGKINITQNGTDIDVANYALADVAVSGGATLVQKTITQNGTYDPADDNADGYSEVTVNVGSVDPFSIYKDYIQSSGSQWIDTGYVTKQNTKFEILVNYDSTQDLFAMIYGARKTPGGLNGEPVCIGVRNNGSKVINYGFGFGFSTIGDASMFENHKTLFKMDSSGLECIKEGDYIHFSTLYTGGSSLPTQSIYLFSLNAGGADFGAWTHCVMKLYNFKIYEGSTLVMDLIPVVNNGVVCLKDNITENYLYNSGTGSFVFGTDSIS